MDRFIEFITEWSTLISFVMVLVALLILFLTVVKGWQIYREHRKTVDREADTLGEELPPMLFTGKIHPHSLPEDFGRSPGRK